MKIEAEIVGGPRDGEIIALHNPHYGCQFVLPVQPIIEIRKENIDIIAPDIKVWSIRPKQRSDGTWVLLWEDRK